MTELILHHYDLSPYSEKVRLMFGLKGLAWRSVQIPIVMPKPDYTELTGGYRRTPMMQIGADIYCDSKLCAQVLERLHPTPSLFPGGDVATVWGLSRWAETGFMMAVLVHFGSGAVFDEAFIEDRKKMVPGLDLERIKAIVPAKMLQLAQNLERLERQLSDGRAFLLGASPSLADLAAYHSTYFLNAQPLTAALLEPHARIPAWLARVAAIGHGDRKELDAADAIAIAHDATPVPFEGEPARAARWPGLRRPRRRAAGGDRSDLDRGRARALRRARDRDPAHARRARASSSCISRARTISWCARRAAMSDAVDFEVRRDDLRTTRLIDDAARAARVPANGQALLRVDHFAFTANNITYAAAGDLLSYWNFFPARAGLGSRAGLGVRRRRGVALRRGARGRALLRLLPDVDPPRGGARRTRTMPGSSTAPRTAPRWRARTTSTARRARIRDRAAKRRRCCSSRCSSPRS